MPLIHFITNRYVGGGGGAVAAAAAAAVGVGVALSGGEAVVAFTVLVLCLG